MRGPLYNENLISLLESTEISERSNVLREAIRALFRSVVGISLDRPFGDDVGFFDLGMDSIMALAFTESLQNALNNQYKLPATLAFDYPSIDDLHEYISKLLNVTELNAKTSASAEASNSDEAALEQLMKELGEESAKPKEGAIHVELSKEPIAVIGMGCRFPQGANSPEEFWHFLEVGVDGISEVPKSRFDIDDYYDPEIGAAGKIYTRKAGFLNVPIDLFDADFFRISPKEVEGMDPQQRLLLEVTWEALEDALIPPKSLEGSLTGIYVGIVYSDYSQLITVTKGFDGMDAYFNSGNLFSAAAGRLSYVLGLQGPCLAIDTACSSSLVAINSACESLRAGHCHQAIAGGINLMLSPGPFISESQAHMLAPDGHSKTFDKSADGFGRGEGCGMLVLKLLKDAERDGDKIYALITGSSVNQDGASGGLTVPSGKAQEALILQACREARLKPDDIDYVEAHGTGTSLGDPIEVRAIGATYGQRDKERPLFLGSVKSQFGHTESAAGVAGVIKTILALNHNTLTANLNFKELNPHIDLNFPVKILTENIPWERGARTRRAGVSSFGFSGINAHVIIEEAPARPIEKSELTDRPLHILALSAKTEKALDDLLERYVTFLETTQAEMADIAYSANTGRNHELYRAAIIAKNVSELKAKINQKEFLRGEALDTKKYEFPDLTVVPDWQKLLEELAEAYTKGARMDWKQWDLFYERQKISLPTYPFQRQHYWAEAAIPSIGKKLASVHPLLGEKYSTPDEEIIYRGELHLSTLPYLKDHQVCGHIIYPAAAYLEMMLASALNGWGEGEIHLNNISIEAALSFDAGKSLETQVIMKSADAGYEIAIYSQAQEASSENVSWHCHARGLLSVSETKNEPSPLNIENIKARCEKILSQKDFYEHINSTGIYYGKHFQTLVRIYVGKEEALGELKITTNAKGYLAHPALLDGAVQLLAASFREEKSKDLYLPVGCDTMEFYASLGDQVLAHWKETEKTEMGRSGDLIFCSSDGKILAKITGMHHRKATEQALKQMLAHESRVEDWLYEWNWQEKSLEKVNIPDPLGHWLVLGDGHVSDQIIKIFESKGATYKQISNADYPKTKEAFVELLKAENFNGILHVGSMGGELPLSAENISAAQSLGTKSILYLTQALVDLEKTQKIPLFLITHRDAQRVTGSAVLHSPLLGLYKTILAEHPELQMKLINLADELKSEQIFEAIFSKSDESILSFKNNFCYVPRLIKAKNLHDSENEGFPQNKIRSDATYLITGGLGGLGLSLAKWLSEKGAGHILLTGRKPLDDQITQTLKNLETEQTRITYESMDVGDEKSVSTLLTCLENSEKPLKGIFHLAGILDDATLMEQDWNHFEKVFRPKVYGSFYLHQYSKNLDLFVMFSSIASSFGNPGQSNYAAANAFMDALCEYRKEQGLAAHSLSWGPWAEVGMAKELVSRHAKGGLFGLKPKEGMRALEVALLLSPAHITIANIHWKNYLKTWLEVPTWLEAFAPEKISQDNLPARLEKISVGDRLEHVRKYVIEIVKAVLGISSSQFVDEKKGFFDMGLDSLMAVELKNRLQAGLGKSVILATTAVFDYASIEKMTAHLGELLKLESIKLKKPAQLMAPLRADEPIAIIGMGCRYPGGANNPEEFWRILETGVDGICEVPKDRFDVDEYYDSQYDVPGKMYVRSGGFLNVPVDLFDADFFGISPKEAQDMDPQQRLLLEVTWETLENASIAPETLEGSATGLYVGMMYSDYSQLIIQSEGVEGMSAYYGSGNAFSAAVGRVSFCLGLQGPCLAIDTACSSSLVAINSACESLRLGQCQQAIAGGVSLMLAPGSFITACQAHMLSPDGHCKTFDKSADGYARAEGCGMILLKRLSDAQRDGDKIFALIKSSGVNQGGATSGLTVPNGKAQEALLRQVYSEVGLKADDIDYVEAHGTGTSLGDPIEVRAIGAAYGDRDPSRPLFLGSAKSNIGHAESAAGVAGVIKIILSLNHEMLPANLNFRELNPNIDLNFPVKILTEKMPWMSGARVRRAGVSSFGFSGTNAHVILEEAPSVEIKESTQEEPPLHLIVLSGKSKKALSQLVKQYQDFLENTTESVANIAYTASTGRNHELFRLAVIAKDLEDLKLKFKNSEFSQGQITPDKRFKIQFQYQDLRDYQIQACVDNVIKIEIGSYPNWSALLAELSAYYIAGAEIDWKAFQSPYSHQKIALPTYPFERKRYWSQAAFVKTSGLMGLAHPLLGKCQELANKTILYSDEWNLKGNAFLSGYRRDGQTIFPKPAFLEILFAVGADLYRNKKISLSKIEFKDKLILSQDKAQETQVLVTKIDDNHHQLSFYSRLADRKLSPAWKCHVEAICSVSDREIAAPAPRRDSFSTESEMSVSQFYEQLKLRGDEISANYQALKNIFIDKNQMLGKIETSANTKGFLVHPAILISAMQLIEAWGQQRYDLLSCDEVLLSKSLRYMAAAKLDIMESDSKEKKAARLIIYNEADEPICRLDNLIFSLHNNKNQTGE